MRKLLWPVVLVLSGCGASPSAPSVLPVALAAEDGIAEAAARKKPSPSPTVKPDVLTLSVANRWCPPSVVKPEGEHELRPGCLATVVCETRWDAGRPMRLWVSRSVGYIELWQVVETEDHDVPGDFRRRLVGTMGAGTPSNPGFPRVSCGLGPFIESQEWTVVGAP